MSRIMTLMIFVPLVILCVCSLSRGSMTDYSATPPFLSTSVASPNILFLVDKSGSMSWAAYNPDTDGTDFCNNVNGCGNSLSGDEEGYFIPSSTYHLVGSCNHNNYYNCYWEASSGSASDCPHTWQQVYDNHLYYTGACLNFLLMSRMDLLRWAITGGRPQSCGGFSDSDCDPDLACTGSTCTLESVWSDRVVVPTSRLNGITQMFEDENTRPRFGVLFFSGDLMSHKVYIGDYPSSCCGGGNADPNHPYTYVKRYINSMDPSGATGTAIAMWEALDYFKQSDDHNYHHGFSLSQGTYKDPVYQCDYQKNNCQLVGCAKNFIILASDGQWNTGGTPNMYGYGSSPACSIDDGYENYSADPVVPAYKMHAETLRTIDSYDINIDAVYTIGLFLGGTGEQSLKNVAMYGSFDTTSNTWPDSLSGYPMGTCTMDDCGSGKGSGCAALPSSSSDWDSDEDGVPDTFVNASNADQIKNGLLTFIRDALKRTAASSSVSVLSDKTKCGTIINQAVFYPSKSFTTNELDWVGYFYTYWLLNTKIAQNFREDTVNPSFFDLTGDYILGFSINEYGNLTIDAYNSATNGTKTSWVRRYSSLDDVNPVWEGGVSLRDRTPDDRDILYAGNSSNSTLKAFNLTNLGANASGIKYILGTSSGEYPSCLGTSLETKQENLVRFIRGEDISGCRSRDTGSGIWKLGDIVYSTPKIVQYKDYSMVFVGANDGMLHAFREGKIRTDGLSTGQLVRLCDDGNVSNCTTSTLGQEEWAFIPKNIMPYLRYLADPSYSHIYYVDLSPYIIQEDTNDDGYIDKRILIGGMRLGGACGCSGSECVNPPSDTCPTPSSSNCVGLSSYFALDITDADNPRFLWEFSDPKLGFSYSGPAYIKRGDSRYIMFVSGPTDYSGDAGQDLKIFVLQLDNSFQVTNITKMSGQSETGFVTRSELSSYTNSFGGRLFTDGIDYDNDNTTDAVFFGVNQKNGSTWQGNLLLIKPDDNNPANWDIDTVFNSATKPITTKIEYMKCFNMNFIYFGTGRWFFKTDDEGQNSNDVENLYGIRIDGCLEGGTCNLNATHNTSEMCSELATNNLVAWKIDMLEPKGSDYYKERVITDPTTSELNLVFFSTTQPSADLCNFGGHSRVWALNCATGGNMTSGCGNQYTPNNLNGTLILQLSRGNIEDISVSEGNFQNEGGRATGWMTGIPPESSAPLTGGPPGSEGNIMLWIEK